MATASHRVRAWSSAEFDHLIDAARRSLSSEIAGVRAADWWEVFVRLAWDTAMRVDDLLEVAFAGLAEDGSLLATCRKTGERVRYMLHPNTIAAIRTIESPTRHLILPWDRSRLELSRRLRGLLKGVPDETTEGGAA